MSSNVHENEFPKHHRDDAVELHTPDIEAVKNRLMQDRPRAKSLHKQPVAGANLDKAYKFRYLDLSSTPTSSQGVNTPEKEDMSLQKAQVGEGYPGARGNEYPLVGEAPAYMREDYDGTTKTGHSQRR